MPLKVAAFPAGLAEWGADLRGPSGLYWVLFVGMSRVAGWVTSGIRIDGQRLSDLSFRRGRVFVGVGMRGGANVELMAGMQGIPLMVPMV